MLVPVGMVNLEAHVAAQTAANLNNWYEWYVECELAKPGWWEYLSVLPFREALQRCYE